MIYVIILNWNGYRDTIDCFESLKNSDFKNFKVVIVDNYSSDESVKIIEEYINSSELNFHFIKNKENFGFSIGCNIGIEYALSNDDCEYIWLLNNDTIIEKNTMRQLVSFLQENKTFEIITPQINYFDNKSLIWNCGGKISKLGFRKYNFPVQNEKLVPHKKFLNVTFLTNCASFFRKEFFSNGYRLDERFFFGEEDFSLSLYALRKRIKMACILNTKIYHKVSSTMKKQSKTDDNKFFIYYMNRLINMKSFYNNKLLFYFYKNLYFIYIKKILKGKIKDIKQFLQDLDTAVKKYDSVNKLFFEKVMKNGYHCY